MKKVSLILSLGFSLLILASCGTPPNQGSTTPTTSVTHVSCSLGNSSGKAGSLSWQITCGNNKYKITVNQDASGVDSVSKAKVSMTQDGNNCSQKRNKITQVGEYDQFTCTIGIIDLRIHLADLGYVSPDPDSPITQTPH